MDLFFFSSVAQMTTIPFEYEGTKIGVSNTITSVKKSFIDSPANMIDIDEIILERMYAHIKVIEEREKLFFCDAIIHGVRVRLTTNSKHLSEFFSDNYFTPKEYQEQLQALNIDRQGSIVPFKVNVYVINGIFENAPTYSYNPNTNTVYIFNCSFYKVTYQLITEAVSKILREDRGFFITRCFAFEKNKRSFAVFFGGENAIQEEDMSYEWSFKMIGEPNVRLQTTGFAVFRFAFHHKLSDKLFSPIKITFADGSVKKGAEALEFVLSCMSDTELRGKNDNAMLLCLTPRDEKNEVRLAEINFDEKVEVLSYPVCKTHYQPTRVVKHHPNSIYQYVHAKLENIPEITQEYVLTNSTYLENFVRNELRGSRDASIAKYFNSISEEDGKKYVARLECFDESHLMIDYSKIFGRPKIFSNPLESAHLKLAIFPVAAAAADFKTSTFMRTISHEEAAKQAGDSPFMKTLTSCAHLNSRFAEIRLFNELTGVDAAAEKPATKSSIYTACIKKTADLDLKDEELAITGANHESFIPPPPPPRAPMPQPPVPQKPPGENSATAQTQPAPPSPPQTPPPSTPIPAAPPPQNPAPVAPPEPPKH